MSKWLYIPVEVKPREFESRLLLSCFAVDAGWDVVFGQQNSITGNLEQLPKGIILDKSISKNKIEELRHSKRLGFTITSLDEEGLSSHDNKFVYLNQRLSEKTLDVASLVFTWGNNEAKIINENYPRFRDKLKVVGNPRVDIWRSDLKRIYQKEALQYKKKYGKYVLLPSSFASRHAKGNNFVVEQARSYGIISNKKEEEEFLSIRNYVKKSYEAHIEMIKRLAKKFPDITFIIRPHPSESRDAWNENKASNVKIIYKGTITPWILGSELVIHNSCTTGLEAYLLGKPVISYRPYEHTRNGKHISNGVSLRFNSEYDVIDACKKILEDESHFKKNLDIWPELYDIIASLDGEMASQKIVRYLDNLQPPENISETISISRIKRFYREVRALYFLLLYKVPILNKKIAYTFQKYPGSSLNEVKKLVEKYKEISDGFDKITVSKIDSKLYHLRKSKK